MERAPGGAGRLGPASASTRPGDLSKARAEVLEILRDQTRPTSLADLSSALGLHENTTREHLDALVAVGLASRASAAPQGRGRPAMLYEATVSDPLVSADHAGLATVLASALDGRGARARPTVVAAGETWGRDLVLRRRAASGSSRAGARRQTLTMLEDLGFTVESDARATRARVHRCPWIDAARVHPDVVCGIHEGVTRGAMAELGGDPETVQLKPFAGPGACELHLLPR